MAVLRVLQHFIYGFHFHFYDHFLFLPSFYLPPFLPSFLSFSPALLFSISPNSPHSFTALFSPPMPHCPFHSCLYSLLSFHSPPFFFLSDIFLLLLLHQLFSLFLFLSFISFPLSLLSSSYFFSSSFSPFSLFPLSLLRSSYFSLSTAAFLFPIPPRFCLSLLILLYHHHHHFSAVRFSFPLSSTFSTVTLLLLRFSLPLLFYYSSSLFTSFILFLFLLLPSSSLLPLPSSCFLLVV